MEEIVIGSRQKINLETWERRAAFHLFKDFTEPYHGVCRVDCTEAYRYAKQHHSSVFLSLLHRSMAAALSDGRTAPLHASAMRIAICSHER
jgi:chloramphenicol O-acetyltransferase type A